MSPSLLLPFLCGALGLHLSLEADPRPGAPFPVHLSVHGLGSVEVVLAALPATPDQLLEPPRIPSEQELRAPPLMAKASSLRDGLARSYRELHADLSAEGRELARELLGLSHPLGESLREGPTAESRGVSGTLRTAWRVDPAERGWNEFDVDLGPLEPGLYRLTAHRAGEWAELRILVSDLSMLAFRDTSGLVLLATRGGTGEGVAEVEVFARVQGRAASLGKTNGQGLLVLRSGQGALELPAGVGPELVGQRGESLARVDVPVPPVRLSPDTGTAALILDRRRYSPGDIVHLWAIPRDVRAGSGGERSLSIPDDNRLTLSLLDREGRVLWQRASEASPLGVVSADVDLPAGLLPGEYTLALAWGDQRRGVGVTVDADVAPELSVALKLGRQSVAVKVADRLGEPLAQAWVHWSLVRLPVSSSWGEEVETLGPFEVLVSGDGITAGTGALELHLPRSLPASARLLVQVEVEDSAGRVARAQGELPPSSAAAIALRLRPERLLARPGKPVTLSVEARGADSAPAHVKLEASFRPVVEGPGGEPQKKEAVRRSLETDAHGHAVLSLPAFSAGYVEVDVALEGQRPSVQALVFVTESGGDIPTTPETLSLVAEPVEHRRPHEGAHAAAAEEQRLLIMTPFESGSVLVTTEPPASGAPQVAVIHGYSGVAHLHAAPTASGLYVSAATLRSGRLFQQWLQLAPSSRAPGMVVRGSFDHPPRAGQHAVLTLQTEDGAGRPLPSQLLGRLSQDGDGSASLADQLRPPYAPSAALTSSRAWHRSTAAATPRLERFLVPYGPSGLAESLLPRSEAVSFVAQTSATGRGQQGLTLPVWLGAPVAAGMGSALLTLRAIAGPDQLGEASHEVTWVAVSRLGLLAPPWVRAGDNFTFAAELSGGEGTSGPSICTAELSVGGTAVAAHCNERGSLTRALASTRPSGSARSLELSATLALGAPPRLSSQQEVAVLQLPPSPRTAQDLARQLARALAQPNASGEQVDLACAAVRAAGAVLPQDSKLAAATVARLGQLERLEGGFGAEEGELRRDLAALEGLTGLRDGVDPGLLERTRARVKVLSDRLDEDQRQALWVEIPRRGQATRGTLDARSATALQLSHWPLPRRGRSRRAAAGAEVQTVLKRLLALLPAADVLDLAEIAVALQLLPDTASLAGETGAPLEVKREYRLLHRSGWTEAILAAGEEPPEPTESALDGSSLPLGAEVAVALSVQVGEGGLHCLRDSLPAGFAPIGFSSSVVREGSLLLCGEPHDGRLSVGYSARAMHAGHFQAPAAAAGVLELGPSSLPPSVVEIAP